MSFNDFVITLGIQNINNRECLGFRKQEKKPQPIRKDTIHKPSTQPHWSMLAIYQLALEQEEDRYPHGTDSVVS